MAISISSIATHNPQGDTCVVCVAIFDFVKDLTVVQRGDLPSDHGPITVSVASVGVGGWNGCLLARAGVLGIAPLSAVML